MFRLNRISEPEFPLYVALRLLFQLQMIFDCLLEFILLIVFSYHFFVLFDKDTIEF